MVVKMRKCFCAKVLYVEQFTSEIISLGWSSGLHGYKHVMLHLTFMFSLFGFQLYYYQMKANEGYMNCFQQLKIFKESFIKTYQQSVPSEDKTLCSFRQRKAKQQIFFLMLFEHKKEAHAFIFRLSKIIHLRVRKACKIFKECFISSRHPRRNMTVQPLFTEHFDVKCLNCQDHSVSVEESKSRSSWKWFDLFSNL